MFIREKNIKLNTLNSNEKQNSYKSVLYNKNSNTAPFTKWNDQSVVQNFTRNLPVDPFIRISTNILFQHI